MACAPISWDVPSIRAHTPFRQHLRRKVRGATHFYVFMYTDVNPKKVQRACCKDEKPSQGFPAALNLVYKHLSRGRFSFTSSFFFIFIFFFVYIKETRTPTQICYIASAFVFGPLSDVIRKCPRCLCCCCRNEVIPWVRFQRIQRVRKCSWNCWGIRTCVEP